VAFNSEALFTSPDDYKNAQFEEVTDLLLSEAWLEEVKAGLAGEDQGVAREQFSVAWRNAGRWELVVRDRNPARAARVAAHWREVAFAQLSDALAHALTFSHLDQQLNATARHLADLTRTHTHLTTVLAAVRAWQSDDPVAPEARAALWAYAGEFSVPRNFPAEDAPRQAYLDWAADLLAVLEAKQSLLDTEFEMLPPRIIALQTDWNVEKAASRGLSAYLVVEQRGEVEMQAVRSPGVMALVGGGVGLLSLLVGWLVNLSRAGRKHG
jgi:hypothetical protein